MGERRALTEEVARRYRSASKQEKAVMLGEFVETTGYTGCFSFQAAKVTLGGTRRAASVAPPVTLAQHPYPWPCPGPPAILAAYCGRRDEQASLRLLPAVRFGCQTVGGDEAVAGGVDKDVHDQGWWNFRPDNDATDGDLRRSGARPRPKVLMNSRCTGAGRGCWNVAQQRLSENMT